MDPFVVGTNAIFEVRAPSAAFKVDTRGWACPCGHRLRYLRFWVGITVVFKTNALAKEGMPQEPLTMFTSAEPIVAAGFSASLTFTAGAVSCAATAFVSAGLSFCVAAAAAAVFLTSSAGN